MYDVIVVGGSYAGMAAALQLLRARRTVLVIDAGQRRNRAASESHGFLGQDGVDPAEIARVAREQLHRYPTLTWIDGRVISASGSADDFAITCSPSVCLTNCRPSRDWRSGGEPASSIVLTAMAMNLTRDASA